MVAVSLKDNWKNGKERIGRGRKTLKSPFPRPFVCPVVLSDKSIHQRVDSAGFRGYES